MTRVANADLRFFTSFKAVLCVLTVLATVGESLASEVKVGESTVDVREVEAIQEVSSQPGQDGPLGGELGMGAYSLPTDAAKAWYGGDLRYHRGFALFPGEHSYSSLRLQFAQARTNWPPATSETSPIEWRAGLLHGEKPSEWGLCAGIGWPGDGLGYLLGKFTLSFQVALNPRAYSAVVGIETHLSLLPQVIAGIGKGG